MHRLHQQTVKAKRKLVSGRKKQRADPGNLSDSENRDKRNAGTEADIHELGSTVALHNEDTAGIGAFFRFPQ